MTVLIRYCIKITIRSLAGVLCATKSPPDVAFFYFLFMLLENHVHQLCESTITSTFY